MRILALIIFMITSYAYGEVIPIKLLESCFSCSAKASMTMY